ncbi:glyoxylase-like metal-dependent hydrolase (beta-lactamase superfamily II) [Streptomyces sp. TLI_235]|nr:MBL fold metallo-hydrolase [Streptomyces sp. TLI_235]PBC77117.1 glyoxylase-like metal-dependent hydrolase (beta-lactamase superfamily II) [Streptomyces sp. TLI_235]
MSRLDFAVVDLPESSLHKTAVLIVGAHGTMLVDTGFTRSDGRRLAQLVQGMDRPLTTVVVSHGDPDFYFGTEEVQNAFPEARFLAHPLVIEHIARTYPEKLSTWAQLGSELPTRPPRLQPLDGDVIEFEGHRFEVRGFEPKLPDRHFLWEHRSRLLLGGVALYQGLHAWTADTPGPDLRASWIDQLDAMEALDPLTVVAGHRMPGVTPDAGAITYTRDYLKAFEREVGKAEDAAAAEEALLRLYPDAGLKLAVRLGTQVAKGELAWD